MPLVRSIGNAFAPEWRGTVGKVGGNADGVALYGVDLAIGSQGQVVAAMPNPALRGVQRLLFVELPVPVRVPQPIQGLRVVGVGVEGAVGIKQASALLQCILNSLGVGDLLSVLGKTEPQQALVLASDGHTALWIEGEADPGALVLAGRAQQFDLVAGQSLEGRGIGSFFRIGGAFPLGVVVERIQGQGRQVPPWLAGQRPEGGSGFIRLPFAVGENGTFIALGIRPVQLEGDCGGIVDGDRNERDQVLSLLQKRSDFPVNQWSVGRRVIHCLAIDSDSERGAVCNGLKTGRPRMVCNRHALRELDTCLGLPPILCPNPLGYALGIAQDDQKRKIKPSSSQRHTYQDVKERSKRKPSLSGMTYSFPMSARRINRPIRMRSTTKGWLWAEQEFLCFFVICMLLKAISQK